MQFQLRTTKGKKIISHVRQLDTEEESTCPTQIFSMLLQSSYTVSYFSYCPYHFESSEKNLKKYTVYSFSVYICEFPYTAKIHSLRTDFNCFLFCIVPSLLFLHDFELHKCKFVAVTELMDETNQTIVETGTQVLAVWLCGP